MNKNIMELKDQQCAVICAGDAEVATNPFELFMTAPTIANSAYSTLFTTSVGGNYLQAGRDANYFVMGDFNSPIVPMLAFIGQLMGLNS